jgi:hypothetical protein
MTGGVELQFRAWEGQGNRVLILELEDSDI